MQEVHSLISREIIVDFVMSCFDRSHGHLTIPRLQVDNGVNHTLGTGQCV